MSCEKIFFILLFYHLDGSIVDYVPVFIIASWALSIFPHLLAEKLRTSVPCIRLLIIVPLAVASFVPLVVVSYRLRIRAHVCYFWLRQELKVS